MFLKTYCILLSLLFGITLKLSGQEKNISRGNQQWFQYYNQTKLAPNWTLLLDGGYRLKDELSQRAQYIGRLGISYQTSGKLNLALGIAHLGVYQMARLDRLEYRPFQELSLKNDFTHQSLSHRFRLEERFFTKRAVNGSAAGHSFNVRFRYRLAWNIPLFRLSNAHPERHFALNLADEIFLNAGEDIVYNIFDQNRLQLGISIPLHEHLSLSLSYNSQFTALNAPATYNHTNIYWLGINHKMDLSKK